ncbi:low temperature requirement protein A [Allorhizocola rhizosphaerae]|uniref:low temperature requirement protein A n=1 Tax=Allorhizocola rhizosphaerae TaxID=1872709 RepID=UPI0013C2E7F8|nr:low temperature requirement protein A [Allorhizocola rhizosphaerae]
MAATSSRRPANIVTLAEGAKVTPAELFLDLVFVYGFTQVTGFMAADLSWTGMVRGMAILGLLWWMWTGFAWLGNIVQADEGPVRMVLFAVVAIVFVVDVTIPEAFVDIPGGLWGPWVFAIGYMLVQLTHHFFMLYTARRLPRIRRNTLMLLVPTLTATALLLVAGANTDPADQTVQTILWVAALAVIFGGIYAIRAEGWQLSAASHFAERHGLIVIVALGETIVAIGVGVSRLPISWEIVVAAVLAAAALAALWWAYFDAAVIAAEHALHRLSDDERPRVARDAYTFIHFPMIAGIILLALGLEKVFQHLADPLSFKGVFALYGGAILFLVAHTAFKLRATRLFHWVRPLASVLLLALIPLAIKMSALFALLTLSTVLVALIAYESVRYAELRDRIRHGQA